MINGRPKLPDVDGRRKLSSRSEVDKFVLSYFIDYHTDRGFSILERYVVETVSEIDFLVNLSKK